MSVVLAVSFRVKNLYTSVKEGYKDQDDNDDGRIDSEAFPGLYRSPPPSGSRANLIFQRSSEGVPSGEIRGISDLEGRLFRPLNTLLQVF